MIIMRITPKYFVPFLIAGATATAIATAPMTVAAPQSCIDVGPATQCVSPGNSQITADAPPIRQDLNIFIIHRHR
jgi:hypothetical protein